MKKETTIAPIKEGDSIKVHYTGKLDDGTIFDDSLSREEPLQFTVGEHKLIEGFEKAVLGMEAGDWKVVKIPADLAYGLHKQELVMRLALKLLPQDLQQPYVGQQLQISLEEGAALIVIVTEISEDKVIVDANHPLAGKDLTFEIKIVEILPRN
jgi:peptidylprolyl isomerase